MNGYQISISHCVNRILSVHKRVCVCMNQFVCVRLLSRKMWKYLFTVKYFIVGII